MFCKQTDCGNAVSANGLCKKHYDQHRRLTKAPQIAAQRKKYNQENKESRSVYYKEYWSRPGTKRLYRDRFLSRTYGITLEHYESMLDAQGGVCAICSSDKPGGRFNNFHVDHDHATNLVRGLLCYPCNHLLGIVNDSTKHLNNAVAYLEEHAKTSPGSS